MKIIQTISIFVISVSLTACSATLEKIRRLGQSPDFTKVEVPVDEQQPTPAQKQESSFEHVRRTNSLWQPGSTTPFRASKTWQPGDILKVVVRITDKATLANSTLQQRNNTDAADINEIYGKKRALAASLGLSKGPAPDALPAAIAAVAPATSRFLDTASNRKIQGSGNIDRKETIQTNVAALVRQVLPNGNLLIEGHQEVRVNHELREVRVAGIIRPKDIASDNSISSDQIAEARISYGGRGIVSDMQNPRIGTQIADIISPF